MAAKTFNVSEFAQSKLYKLLIEAIGEEVGHK